LPDVMFSTRLAAGRSLHFGSSGTFLPVKGSVFHGNSHI
jgi:hypothetical protein